jgi:multiple sugar transport system ATP-binding protein
MRVEIKRLHQLNPTTTIYVTHDQVEAMTLADKVVVMNGGQIEQVGTPQDLYHRPATRFVASFVGSPQMNMFEVAIHVAEGAVTGTMKDGQTFVFPLNSPPAIRRYEGKTLLLGIRPEHLRIADEMDSGGFVGHVDLLEPLGHETLVYGAIGEERWCAKADPSTCAHPAQSARLLPDFARAHLIDPETDQVVTLAS